MTSRISPPFNDRLFFEAFRRDEPAETSLPSETRPKRELAPIHPRQVGAYMEQVLHVLFLQNVKKLSLTYLQLDRLPESFKQLRQLKKLDLSNNLFRTIPTVLNFHPTLQSLAICDNKISLISDQTWKNPTLTTLWIKRNPLTALPLRLQRLELSLGLDLHYWRHLNTHAPAMLLFCHDEKMLCMNEIHETVSSWFAIDDLMDQVYDYVDLVTISALRTRLLKILGHAETKANLTRLGLTDLQYLEYNQAHLSLSRCTHIDLSENDLYTIPSWLFSLPKLQKVSFNENALEVSYLENELFTRYYKYQNFLEFDLDLETWELFRKKSKLLFTGCPENLCKTRPDFSKLKNQARALVVDLFHWYLLENPEKEDEDKAQAIERILAAYTKGRILLDLSHLQIGTLPQALKHLKHLSILKLSHTTVNQEEIKNHPNLKCTFQS